MAHDSRLTEWLQFESSVRSYLPAHISQLLYRFSPRSREEEFRAAAERLAKENEELRQKVEVREAELSRAAASNSAASSVRGSQGEPGSVLSRDSETGRLKAQLNEDTLDALERTLALYRDKVKKLEEQRKEEGVLRTESFSRSFWPLRFRERSLDLTPLLSQAISLDTNFWALIQSSESTVSALAGKFSPLSDDLLAKIEELKQDRNSLRSEPFTSKTYTPQEAAEKLSIVLANTAAKEELLRRYEVLKRDLSSQWSELNLAKVVTAQKETASAAIANAYVSAKEHQATEELLKALAAIELTAAEVSQSEEPMLERCFAMESQLLALANAHRDILALGKSEESGSWDLQQLHAEQQKVADFSEETLEQLLHVSGKPKDQLSALKSQRAKLLEARDGPLKPGDLLALMQLLMDFERAKRDVFEQAKVRMEQLTEQEQEAQQRLRRVLEQSESDIVTLSDLAIRDGSNCQKFSEDRRNAQNLAQLIALEEEHQALRSQLLKDVPHVLVTADALKSLVSTVKTMHDNFKPTLSEPALTDYSQGEPALAEAAEALEAVLGADSKDAKERSLLTAVDQLCVFLSKHAETQQKNTGGKKELEAVWKELLGMISELVTMLADGFHKLTIDDPETRAELEEILETQNLLTPTNPQFSTGFQFCLQIISATKRMLHDTNNLTEVIADLQDVYQNLVKFQEVMQSNYYKLKPVVGTEEVPGRRGKRGQTFVHIAYAPPSNPKEGINILQNMISTLKMNTNNLFEIESKRVLVVENSLNIKRAQEGLQRLQEIEREELRLRSENLASVGGDAAAVAEAQALAEQCLDPMDQIPNYAESITFYLKQVAPWLERSLEFDIALNKLLKKNADSQSEAIPAAESH